MRLLKDVSLFKGMKPEELEVLAQQAAVSTFSRKGVIYLPNQAEYYVYFIKTGYVKVGTFSEAGNELIFDIAGPGEMVGNIASSSVSLQYAEALTDCRAWQVRLTDLETFLLQHPEISLRLIRLVSERAKSLERKISSIIFKDARGRIVELLHSLAAGGRTQHGSIILENVLTHQDIANLTATSRQTVTTVLADLRAKGFITYSRKELIFPVHAMSHIK
jgi:CRP/FNR family transcriptional regulator, cyclic AMP receptor protein